MDHIINLFYVYQVCEVCLELLHDRGLLSCISIAKFEGKDSDKEVIIHIVNREAYPNGGHILDQLRDLKQLGISIDNRHLQFRFFECHDLACSYDLVTRGAALAIGNNFCPWCYSIKPTSTNVAVHIDINALDTLSSIGATYYMRESLLRVRFRIYNNGFIF